MMSREARPTEEDVEVARRLMRQVQPGKASVILLSTISSRGRPHATWMFASRSTDPGIEILTITSPESQKVGYLAENPGVEWLLTSPDRMEQLYLEGEAEIVDDVTEIKRLWAMIGGKDRAFFMKYYNSGLGFSVVRTVVDRVSLVYPERNRRSPIPLVVFDGNEAK